MMAVDPGGESGWVRVGFHSVEEMDSVVRSVGPARAVRHMGSSGEVSMGTFKSVFGTEAWAVHEWAWEHLHGVDVLIVEDFILRRGEKSRSLLSPVRLGSMLEYEWRVVMGRSSGVVWSAPSDKTSVPDRVLVGAGIFQRGRSGGHINDALRHLCLYLGRRI